MARRARDLLTSTSNADASDDLLPVVIPGTVVVIRPGNRLQIGSGPDNGLVVELGGDVSARALAGLLVTLESPRRMSDIATELATTGLTPNDLSTLLDHLVAAGRALRGLAATPRHIDDRLRHIRVHGSGPLGGHLATSLADAGFSVTRSSGRPSSAHPVSEWQTDLVVLTDYLVHDTMLVTGLMDAGTPHLQVRMRDGVGVVGPLVLPRLTSCLICIDLHRADLDPEWPIVSAQLVRVAGHGRPATVRATAALAHEHIDQLSAAIGAPQSTRQPELLGRTVELHSGPTRIVTKTWVPHPLCRCRYDAAAG
ncbi:hypothetical protein [Gordonia aichiensis]|uniref:Bacteriocin biosynthesis cyclodehydratase domain-containing protein n=1 Tax=Gordonia aichiensis NBRC 108223 TaxID=1220583 RepID=L7KFR2_9ACTN|nr:hypothetical protein [Gordonia aichiensis]GAC47444.1 hypothetical protein GOACH_03_04650 [Gordonia aichiensis NBRC 108223]